MTDYTKLYPGKTPLDAKRRYAWDLLKRYCRGSYRTGTYVRGACDGCEYKKLMGEPKACGWALDEDPDKAIRVLEELLDIPFEPEYDTKVNLRRIARANGVETVMRLMQEECAELIQAISKWLRYASEAIGEDEDHVAEEMADVCVLIDELCILLPSIRRSACYWRDKKIGRTLERLGLKGPEDEQTDAFDPIGSLVEGIGKMRACCAEPKVAYVSEDFYKRMLAQYSEYIIREDGVEYLTVAGVKLRIIPSDPCGLFTWTLSADEPPEKLEEEG